LAVAFIVVQFFPIDKTNPAYDAAQDFLAIHQPEAEMATLIKNTCYDCHSHETTYPWYTNVAPVSWWIKGHIDHGKEHFNFSEFGLYEPGRAAHKLEEAYEETEEKHMPLSSYTWMHPEAKLSDEDRTKVVEYFKGLYAAAEQHGGDHDGHDHDEHSHDDD
ncbi:MAG: heme-binding domain-containing protein, partial [Bacteroidota bacterium]